MLVFSQAYQLTRGGVRESYKGLISNRCYIVGCFLGGGPKKLLGAHESGLGQHGREA
jgi:hypothetical protein